MDTLRQDLRYAVRTLAKSPGFTAVAVLTLAIGIGANTAMFGVVNAVLLRPFSYPQADELVAVWTRYLPSSGSDYQFFALSWPELSDYQRETRALREVGAFNFATTNLTDGAGEPERLQTINVTANLFNIIGTRPALGRTFAPEEDQPGAPCVVVMGHALWLQRFGGDSATVGRRLNLEGTSCQVIGVMPASFTFPTSQFQLWRPFALRAGHALLTDRASHWIMGVGRLAPGASQAAADEELRTIAAQWALRYPQHHGKGHFLVLQPLKDALVGQTQTPLLLLLGSVGLVLLIICANIANLQLARAEGRRREIAVRAALGAGRRRLVQQLLTESLTVALVGGALGVLLAVWLVLAIPALYPGQLPRADQIGIDARVLLFSAIASVLAGVGFGLAPALQSASRRIQDTLRAEGRSIVGHSRGARMRRALIVGQVALALALVTGAALLARSVARLRQVALGFDPHGVMTARVTLPAGSYDQPSRVEDFYRNAAQRLAALPGVLAAGAISNLPLATWPAPDDFLIEGRPAPAPGEPEYNAGYYMVTRGALAALGVPLLRGRGLTESDASGSSYVALINEAAARRFWPGEDALGHRIRYYGPDSIRALTIVGVVGDTRYRQVQEEPRPAVYVPHAQLPRINYNGRDMSLVTRGRGNASALAPAIRRAIHELDPRVPVSDLQPMESIVSQAIGFPHLLSRLMGVFAGVALLLSALGLYGLVAFTVRQRTNEFGVRLALGASPRDVYHVVLGQGLRLTAGGVTIGLLVALALGRVLASQLYGVSATDPWTFGGVAAGLLLVALAACAVPARRAARMDPMVALRTE